MNYNLTSEQETIISHPPGHHARILAVAGSGKTTTMVHRIRYLVGELHEDPGGIRIVMFNRLARKQFEEKLSALIPASQIKVYTFHAIAYRLWKDAETLGLVPSKRDLWIEEREELARICMHRVIDKLLRERLIDSEAEPDEALQNIGLWKSSLIPPERAGHKTNHNMPVIYRYFEKFRLENNALTFDDFIPEAMNIIENNQSFRKRWTNRIKYLIVDEYQDINYGQEQLIRILAGTRADVMVVGDDDQTIYEWRAARPSYILSGFKEDFSNKPVLDYTLSRTFRFGPLVAQSACNVINFNNYRENKSLISHDRQANTEITIISTDNTDNIASAMTEEVKRLMNEEGVNAKSIGILGRTYVQLENLQSHFIKEKIPFIVPGMAPFFERNENKTLVDYIRLALAWNYPAKSMKIPEGKRRGKNSISECPEALRTVLAVANTPSRKLSRVMVQKAVERGHRNNMTLGESLLLLIDERKSPFSKAQRSSMEELVNFLHRISERIASEPSLKAGEMMEWIFDSTGYENHFKDYYGDGIVSYEKLASVKHFISFASDTGKTVIEFIKYLKKLDSTMGEPVEKIIAMTTVHRTKGLEYDYVFIPDCIEGHMPVHLTGDTAIYDKNHTVPDIPPSPLMENERRLFYVAITRAKKHLYIGTVVPGNGKDNQVILPCRFLEEIQIEPVRAILKALDGLDEFTEERLTNFKDTLSPWASYSYLIREMAKSYIPGLNGQMDNIFPQPERVFNYGYKYKELNSLYNC
ncbi:MAG: ATP-dependent helicase [Candidatus Eremiobacterota bacterium]